jgi:hypothetical protein
MKLAMLLAAATTFLPACAAQQDGVQYLSDYQEARKLSRQTGKPLLVQFRCEA